MRVAACVVAAGLAVAAAGCGADDGAPWAQGATDLFDEMAVAYDGEDPYEAARFYSAGGSLDLTVAGVGVITSPLEVMEALEEQAWFMNLTWGARANVAPLHEFVGPEGAFVWWYASDPEGTHHFAQEYVVGPGARVASRFFLELGYVPGEGWPPPGLGTREAEHDLYRRYVDAWASGDPAAVAALYTPHAVVRDGIAGTAWRGGPEIGASAADGPPMEPGPWPELFAYVDGDHVELLALVQLGGDCPVLEARHWVLDGGAIADETRVTHVPSARRCGSGLPGGWWDDVELPPSLDTNVTATVTVDGAPVELVNAEPLHVEFTEWLFGRYADAGLGLPEVAAVWYPPSPDCREQGGLAIEADERYGGRATVVICNAADDLASDDSVSGWRTSTASYGLHELGHVWMLEHLTDDVRDAFDERAGLASWRSAAVDWRDRGVEHAAFTLAWGLAGTGDARYYLDPDLACEELAARFELLTGAPPLTTCPVATS